MAGGNRPVVTLSGKRKRDASSDLPEYIDIAAFWTDEDDPAKLGGMWSKTIRKIRLTLKDGSEVTIENLNANYFCNIRDEREGSQRAGRPAPNPVRRQSREAPPDFGDADYGAAPAHKGWGKNDPESQPPDFGDDDIPL